MPNAFRQLRSTRAIKWLIVPRLIAGLPLVMLGVKHFIDPEHFRSILAASGIPMIGINMIAAPAAEIAAGALLLLGWYGRIGGALGVATMVPAIYSTVVIGRLDPAHLPAGVSTKPFVPPLPLPLAVLMCSIIVVVLGAGAWSADLRSRQRPTVSS